MLRIVSACHCRQKEKRWAKRLIAVSQRLFQRNGRKNLDMKILWSRLKTLRSASHFRFKSDSHGNEAILDFI